MSSVSTSGLNCGIRCSAITPLAAAPDHFEHGILFQRVRDQTADDHRIVHHQHANPLAGLKQSLVHGLPMPCSSRMNSDEFELLDQDFFGERLHDVLVGARLQRGRHLVQFGFGGDHDDTSEESSGFWRNRLSNSSPFISGMFQSARTSRNRPFLRPRSLQRLPSVGRLADLETQFLQSLARIIRTALESSTTSAFAIIFHFVVCIAGATRPGVTIRRHPPLRAD